MLVKDICILANKSPFILNKFLIINWSNGLGFQSGKELNNEFCIYKRLIFTIAYL